MISFFIILLFIDIVEPSAMVLTAYFFEVVRSMF